MPHLLRYLVPNPIHTQPSCSSTPEDPSLGSGDLLSDENCLPRDRIAALPLWCSAIHGSNCQRCVAVCPTQAIALSSITGPHINEKQCTRCGLCSGICDAFISERYTLADLFNHVVHYAHEEGAVYFTCNEHIFPDLHPRDNVIILPCLGAVPPEFWAAIMAENIEINLYRDPSYCKSCTVAGSHGATLFEYALHTAQDWMDGTINTCHILPEKQTILETFTHIEESDRRDLLLAFAHQGKDIATGQHRKRNAGSTQNFREQQDRLRAEGRIRAAQIAPSRANTAPLHESEQTTNESPHNTSRLGAKYHPWDRQKLLVQAAQKQPARAAFIQRYSATTDTNLCQQTHTCIAACPTGARYLDDTHTVQVNSQLCIACGACVERCPEQACDYHTLTALAYCTPNRAD